MPHGFRNPGTRPVAPPGCIKSALESQRDVPQKHGSTRITNCETA